MFRSFFQWAIGIGVSIGAVMAITATACGAQTPEIRALKQTARALDAREESLTVRLEYVKRDSVIIYHSPLDSLAQRLYENGEWYRRELAALTAPDYSLALLAGSVLSGYAWGSVRGDPGGYSDSWGTIDKEAHMASCAALYAGLRAAGLPRWLAVTAPLLGGLALEAGQSRNSGHFSRMDLAANGAGCGLAWAVDLGIERVRR